MADLTRNAASRDETDYQDLSLSLEKRLGWNWDNLRPDWQRAVDIANQYQTTGKVSNGNITTVIYQLSGGIIMKGLEAATSATGDVNTSVVVWPLKFGNWVRIIA